MKHWTVFVYGTLKRGEPNHHWLTNTENGTYQFLGLGRVRIGHVIIFFRNKLLNFIRSLSRSH